MHSLETIHRLNAEAHARHLAEARASGPVVVHRTGLHVMGVHAAADLQEAERIADDIRREDGVVSQVTVLPQLS